MWNLVNLGGIVYTAEFTGIEFERPVKCDHITHQDHLYFISPFLEPLHLPSPLYPTQLGNGIASLQN